MNPGSKRGGVMTLKTVGRAFWIGLGLSLALHVFLLAKGRFEMPRWEEDPPLEARLEAVEPVAAPLPGEPPADKAIGPAEASPRAQPQQAPALPAPMPAAPVAQAVPSAEAAAHLADPARVEPALPLSAAPATPQTAQPYAALTEAAKNLRELPARIEIVYELNGLLSGRQTHVWQRNGQSYSLETSGEVTGLAGLFVSGKMVQKSRGRIGGLGLMPEYYEMQRFSGKKETLTFDYDANTIESSRTDAKRGTRTLALPMLPGAQDPLSSIYQLALAAQDGKNGLIVAASSKKVKGYPYRMLGTETQRTPLGEMKTLHIVRAGDTEKSGTHLWLAPEQHSLPVKVIYVDEDGTEWVLEAVSIKTQ
jgi:hypothetical protein